MSVGIAHEVPSRSSFTMILSLIWWFTSTDYHWLYICIPIDAWFWFIFYNIPFKLWLDGPPQALVVQNDRGERHEKELVDSPKVISDKKPEKHRRRRRIRSRISKDLDMLYQSMLDYQRIAENIATGLETRNRIMMSELELLEPQIREQVEEHFRSAENQVRILVNGLIASTWNQQCLVMGMKEYTLQHWVQMEEDDSGDL
ncbi:hypothetical protein F5Y09DRAFT_134457 [Xylaria sp. FL1042]|nr:hypothetical protein F5Y09DRAFT_134457 [Xylaria sp. FL1042]